MLSIGPLADPISKMLFSVSQLKRLEFREGAEALRDKERRDFAAARELTTRCPLLTPKPGTQQDRFPHENFWELTLSSQSELLTSSAKFMFKRLEGRASSSGIGKASLSPGDNKEMLC